MEIYPREGADSTHGTYWNRQRQAREAAKGEEGEEQIARCGAGHEG
jgi:hypothetical protein